MANNISIIIPAFNEEGYISSTVHALIAWPYKMEIIIVDDGSTDSTRKIISSLAQENSLIKNVFLSKNQGKGQALMAGVKQATGDILLFLDADLGYSAKYAVQLLNPILVDGIDMTVAILPKSTKKAGFGLVKGLARKGIFLLSGFNPAAPLSGQRAMKRQVLDKITNLAAGFGIEVGLTIDTINNGFIVKEVEIPLKHRETGRDLKGFIHRGREFIAVLKTLLSSIKKHKSTRKTRI